MPEATGILGCIIAAKREELSRRFDGVSLDRLRACAHPTQRSLAASIARPGARFILEIKKASPSLGMIRAWADSATMARGYAGVADALSILTDGLFFGGSAEDVRAARQNFSGPILAKDFFIDRRQVAEARIAGADAILVMLSVLDDLEAREMIAEAHRFGMDALVEVHDEAEMSRALALGATLIGINNRDLRDLSIDLTVTERLAPLAGGRRLVSESGIDGRGDIDRLAGRVDGFLIGSRLMTADDPAAAARSMIFGRVKLCGLNRVADVKAAAPACFAGLVFVPESPRFVSLKKAAALVELAWRRGIKPVGIFRNAGPEAVVEAAATLRLAAVQLHGQAEFGELRRGLPSDCEIWGAVSVGNGKLDRPATDRLVFDNGPGGTSRAFDWNLIEGHPDLARALVAGGIGPANVRAAAQLGAYAVDVGSSVDEVPGVKSGSKIQSLFDALRPAGRKELLACA